MFPLGHDDGDNLEYDPHLELEVPDDLDPDPAAAAAPAPVDTGTPGVEAHPGPVADGAMPLPA